MYCRNCGYYEKAVDTWQCPNCNNVNYVPFPETKRLEPMKNKMHNKPRKKINFEEVRPIIFGALILVIVIGMISIPMLFDDKENKVHPVPGFDFSVETDYSWDKYSNPGGYDLVLYDEGKKFYFYVLAWENEELTEGLDYKKLQELEIENIGQEIANLEIFQNNKVILDTEKKKICSAGFTLEKDGEKSACRSYAIDLPESGEKVWVVVEGDYSSLGERFDSYQDEIEAMVMSIE